VLSEIIDGVGIDEQLLTGPVAHLAARLVSVAPPSAVVLCDVTRQLIGRRFELRPMKHLQLAGFVGAVTAWQALSESVLFSRFEALRVGRGVDQLVGREPALAQLTQSWEKAVAGCLQLVELVGEAGIGKSRMARALEQSLASAKALHLDMQFTPRTRNAPLYPIGVLLRRLAGVQVSDDEPEVIDKTRVLLASSFDAQALDEAAALVHPLVWLQDPGASPAHSPELVREQTIALIVQWVCNLSQSQPVLAIVEDLHWSDATTLVVLKRLAELAPSCRLMLLATRRPEGEPMLAEREDVLRLSVEPLNTTESRRLVRQLTDEETLADATIEAIVERAEGSPLFLEELTRDAIEHGPRQPAAIPATLQTLIQARVDRHPMLRPLLQAAAVLGREFAPGLLARMSDEWPDGDTCLPLTRLMEAGILAAGTTAANDSMRFRHALIHDAVYQTLLRSDRQRLHARVAQLLEAEREAANTPLDVLAHHWAQAGNALRAVQCLALASRTMALRAAYQESIGHAQAGLQLIDQINEADAARRLRRELLAQAGHSRTAILGYAAPSVEQSFASALELCDDATDPQELYPIVRGLGSYYLVRGRIAHADALARQAVQLAERSDRCDLLIDALAFAAYPAFYAGRLDDCQRDLERSLALYESAGGSRYTYPNVQEPGTAAWALLTSVAWLRGEWRRADAAAEAMKRHLERLNCRFDDTFGTVWLAASHILQRRFAAAAQLAQAGFALAQTHGFGTWVPAAMMQLCMAQGALASAPQAIDTLQQVHGSFVAAGAEVSLTYYLWGIALSLDKAGERVKAREVAAQGLQRALHGEESYLAGELHLLMAQFSDDAAQAQYHQLQALQYARQQGARTIALRALASLFASVPGSSRHEQARYVLATLDSPDTLGADDDDFVERSLKELEADVASLALDLGQAGAETQVHAASSDIPITAG
jgi:hypothetical protein